MKKRNISIILMTAFIASVLSGCGSSTDTVTTSTGTSDNSSEVASSSVSTESAADKTLRVAFSADISTMDVQITSSDYGIPLNIYDRLFEIQLNDDGSTELANSLCEEYSVSEDGLTYNFKLREGVKFSNGEALTASDVLYTFVRNLTIEQGVNYDFVNAIDGAEALYNGEADTLEGIEIVDDYNFTVTLAQPFAGFIYQLATPACSIYDEQTTEAAGDSFGIDPAVTVGTGPYVVENWTVNSSITLVANPNYWGETPSAQRVEIKIMPDASTMNMAYQNGELDILDLDNIDSSIVESTYKTAYADNIVAVSRVALTYFTLNQNIEPFNNIKVRQAIQMAIDRETILNTVYGGSGNLEDGIFPRGLVAHNTDLEGTIKYDPEGAKALLTEAGYPDGFTMELSLDSSAGDSTIMVYQIIQQDLAKVGITAEIKSYDESAWLDLRKSGEMGSFVATWTADYNDPDNFIYSFFGTEEKTKARSLNYPDISVMEQVAAARGIVDDAARMQTYKDLENKIVIEDAAWVPLYSREHLFAISDRVEKFVPFWSGYSDSSYANVTLK